MAQARAYALKHNLSQEGFSELLALDAASQIGTQESIKNAKADQLGKLGAAGTARMEAATTWLKAQLGEELGKEFTTYLYTAKQVEGVEKLMSNFRGQGTGTYTPQHGQVPSDKGEIPGFDKMTFAQKRFAQDQLNPPRAAAR